MAESIELMKHEGKKIEMKDREKQYQGKAFVKAAFYADLEKVQGSIQGKEFCRDILALTFDNIELLNLGDGVQQIVRPINPAVISGNDLGVGIVLPFVLPIFSHHASCESLLSRYGLTLTISRSIAGFASSISAMDPKRSV